MPPLPRVQCLKDAKFMYAANAHATSFSYTLIILIGFFVNNFVVVVLGCISALEMEKKKRERIGNRLLKRGKLDFLQVL